MTSWQELGLTIIVVVMIFLQAFWMFMYLDVKRKLDNTRSQLNAYWKAEEGNVHQNQR